MIQTFQQSHDELPQTKPQSREEVVAVLPAVRGKLLPYPLPIRHELVRQIDLLYGAVRARHRQRVISARVQLRVGRDAGAVVAVPPLIVLPGPGGERHAGDVPTAGAGACSALVVHKQRGRDEDEHDAEDEPRESHEEVPETGPEGGGDAEEVRGEALDRAQAAQEAVHHPAEVREVVDEGGEADEAVDDDVEQQPQ